MNIFDPTLPIDSPDDSDSPRPDERAEFIRSLQKKMHSSPSSVERTQATALYARLVSKPLDIPSRPLMNRQPSESKHEPTDNDETVAFARREHPSDGLCTLLHLIQPDRWMKGAWDRTDGGWFDVRARTDLSFDEARVMIADRIEELNLDPEKVWAHPSTHYNRTVAEHMIWIRSDFETQMETFRTPEPE